MGPRHGGDERRGAGGAPRQSNDLSLLPCKGLAGFSPSSAHVDWIRNRPCDLEASEQLQIQKGIFVPVLNINLKEAPTRLFAFKAQLHP